MKELEFNYVVKFNTLVNALTLPSHVPLDPCYLSGISRDSVLG